MDESIDPAVTVENMETSGSALDNSHHDSESHLKEKENIPNDDIKPVKSGSKRGGSVRFLDTEDTNENSNSNPWKLKDNDSSVAYVSASKFVYSKVMTGNNRSNQVDHDWPTLDASRLSKSDKAGQLKGNNSQNGSKKKWEKVSLDVIFSQGSHFGDRKNDVYSDSTTERRGSKEPRRDDHSYTDRGHRNNFDRPRPQFVKQPRFQKSGPQQSRASYSPYSRHPRHQHNNSNANSTGPLVSIEENTLPENRMKSSYQKYQATGFRRHQHLPRVPDPVFAGLRFPAPPLLLMPQPPLVNGEFVYPRSGVHTTVVNGLHVYDPDALKKMLRNQIMNQLEYYFSEENLLKDTYMREHMEKDGWVSLPLIAGFNRMKKLTTDMNDIIEAIKQSNIVELDDAHLRVRSRVGYRVFMPPSGIAHPLLNPNAPEFVPVNVTSPAATSKNKGNLQPGNGDVDDDLTPTAGENLPLPGAAMDDAATPVADEDGNIGSRKLPTLSSKGATKTKDDDDVFYNENWKEVKKAKRTRRKSFSDTPDRSETPDLVEQSKHRKGSQEELEFAFSAEEDNTDENTAQQRKQMALKAKELAKYRGRRRHCTSSASEDDMDDTMLDYLLVITPSRMHGASSGPGTLSSGASSCSGASNPVISSHRGPPQHVLAKHPSGDRHPNPDYTPRSKMTSELAEEINQGLAEFERLAFRRGRSESSSSSISVSLENTKKVNVISSEEFESITRQMECQDVSSQAPLPPPPPPSLPYPAMVVVPPHLLPPVQAPSTITIPGGPRFSLAHNPAVSTMGPTGQPYNPPFCMPYPPHSYLISGGPAPRFGVPTMNYMPPYYPGMRMSYKPPTDLGQATLQSSGAPGKMPRKRHGRQMVGFYPALEKKAKHVKSERKSRSGSTSMPEADVGFAFDVREHKMRSRTVSTSSESGNQNVVQNTFLNHPSQRLLQDNGFTFHAFNKYRANCLKDRESKGKGMSQEMHTMYRFWSFFLREHFNKSMYRDFKKFAQEDDKEGHRYGVECLFRFYSYGLEKRFRKDLYKDFQEEVLRDYDNGHLYGLEKFWAFLHYSQRKVEIEPRLTKILENYKTIEDFRVNFVPPDGFFIDKNRKRTKSELSTVSMASDSVPIVASSTEHKSKQPTTNENVAAKSQESNLDDKTCQSNQASSDTTQLEIEP